MMKPILLGILVLAVVAATAPALAEHPSPLKQLQAGVEPSDIRCNTDRVHVIRDSGNHACVTENTAQRLGWIVLEDDPVQAIEILPAERETLQASAKITVVPQPQQGAGAAPAIPGSYYAYATYTYPEQIEMGVPFAINYTYTYERTFYGNETEYPHYDSNVVYYGDDDDYGYTWWVTREPPYVYYDGTTKPTAITVTADHEIAVHTSDFEAERVDRSLLDHYGAATYEEYWEKVNLPYRGLAKYVPFNNTGIHSGHVTLQIDGKDGKEYHVVQIQIDELAPTQDFVIYVEGQKGHIHTDFERRVFPIDHVEYLRGLGVTASERQVAGALNGVTDGSGMLDYQSPFNDQCTEHISWDGLDADERLWHIMYYDCPDSYPIEPTAEQLSYAAERVAHGEVIREYFEAFNVTSGFRAHIEEVRDFWGFTQEEIDGFFNTYPDLETQSLDPSSNFFQLARRHHAPTMFVAGNIMLQQDSAMISPNGFEVCLFDEGNDGRYNILRDDGRIQAACRVLNNAVGGYGIVVTNDDPDDSSGVDLVVGIRSVVKALDNRTSLLS